MRPGGLGGQSRARQVTRAEDPNAAEHSYRAVRVGVKRPKRLVACDETGSPGRYSQRGLAAHAGLFAWGPRLVWCLRARVDRRPISKRVFTGPDLRVNGISDAYA